MAKIELVFEKHEAAYTPGETISGKAVLTIDKQTKHNGINARLQGVEHVYIRRGKHSSTQDNKLTEANIALKQGHREVLNPGAYEFPFQFALPPELPPTYSGNCVIISYDLKVWVDMPMWFDVKVEKEIFVAQKMAVGGAPITISSDTLNTQKPSFALSIEKSAFQAGENIHGKITVFNPQNSSLKQAIIKLMAEEHAGTSWANSRVTVFEIECPVSGFAYGIPKEFSIPIPANAPPSYTSKISGIDWILEARLDIPLWFDIKAKGAINVHRSPGMKPDMDTE